LLEENSGRGGSRCRWGEKKLVKILYVTAKKFFTPKVKNFFAQEWKKSCVTANFSLPSGKNSEKNSENFCV